MKTTSLLLAFLFHFVYSNSQQVSWLQSSPVKYTLNPQLTSHFISASSNNVFTARLDSMITLNGSDIYGIQNIDCSDSTGNLKWTFPIGPLAMISDIASDNNGELIVGGYYMETLFMNFSDSLLNTGSGFTINIFLLKIDSSGTLKWKRNLTLTYPTYTQLFAINTDKNNNAWYVIHEFNTSKINKTDSSGLDVQSYTINGSRVTSSISFDEFNNLYVAGSTESGVLSFPGMNENIPESYMMFVGRINSSGTTSWIRLAHDVTFQRPQVIATINGNAFLGCNILDSTTWGALTFHGPQWIFDFFVVLVDSTGNFIWGVEPAITPTILGDIQTGNNKFIGTDDTGNLYISTTVRGQVDWGNNVISNSGLISLSKTSLLSFDFSGLPRWCINGGSSIACNTFNLSVNSYDNLYFASSGQDSITFNPFTTNTGGSNAIAFGKISPSNTTNLTEPGLSGSSFVYPNPFSENIFYLKNHLDNSILMSIYTLEGKELIRKELSANGVCEVNTGIISPGIYFYRIISLNSKTYSGKLIKLY